MVPKQELHHYLFKVFLLVYSASVFSMEKKVVLHFKLIVALS